MGLGLRVYGSGLTDITPRTEENMENTMKTGFLWVFRRGLLSGTLEVERERERERKKERDISIYIYIHIDIYCL